MRLLFTVVHVLVSLAYYDGNSWDSDTSLSATFCSPHRHVRYSSNQLFSPLTVALVIVVYQTQIISKRLRVAVWCRKLKITPSYTYLLTDWR